MWSTDGFWSLFGWRSGQYTYTLLTYGGDSYMWELLICGGDIHLWELLTCGGDIHMLGLLTCGGDIHMWELLTRVERATEVKFFTPSYLNNANDTLEAENITFVELYTCFLFLCNFR